VKSMGGELISIVYPELVSPELCPRTRVARTPGGTLVVEAKLLNRDAGFVDEGQPVAVKLEAFPYTRHGTIAGTIESIGSDAVEDEKLGPVYPVTIKLDCAAENSAKLCGKVSAGMAATADIRTGRRSLLSYLVSPIEEAGLEAGRER
jgi:hemolysin D